MKVFPTINRIARVEQTETPSMMEERIRKSNIQDIINIHYCLKIEALFDNFSLIIIFMLISVMHM